ncbi:MAG: hypothetical protein HY330_03705, partial [Chloroflexi bacterium]|nr:hypothetical protein [Chloroflexota bacterium]
MKAPIFMATALVAVLALSTCGRAALAIPTVSVGAGDFSFNLVDSIPAGRTRVQLTNNGKEGHHAQLLRLNQGVTLDRFRAALRQGFEAWLPLVTLEGGPAGVAPGGKSEAMVNLQPGQYMVVCLESGPDHVPHLFKGMIKPLTVTAAPAAQPPEPKAEGTVAMSDFEFGPLSSLKASQVTLKVVNKGREAHELVVLRLKGISAAEANQVLTRIFTMPGATGWANFFEEVGGLMAIMPGATGWATVDLKSGDYVLICTVPSPPNRAAPHIALGMS